METACCSGVVRNSELRRESELDVDVEGDEYDTVQAFVSLVCPPVTAVVACGEASVIGTSPIRIWGVTVFARWTAGGFAASAGFGASRAIDPARVSVGGVTATVSVDDDGANLQYGYLRLPEEWFQSAVADSVGLG